MRLRFFSDHCVPTEIVVTLRNRGYDVILLRDVMPKRSPDHAVIAKAQELECVLLSLNGDFADIVAYPPGQFGGIVAIQLHNHPEIIPRLMERLLNYANEHPEWGSWKGKLFVVEAHRIRIRG